MNEREPSERSPNHAFDRTPEAAPALRGGFIGGAGQRNERSLIVTYIGMPAASR